jgi:hypothetical protein
LFFLKYDRLPYCKGREAEIARRREKDSESKSCLGYGGMTSHPHGGFRMPVVSPATRIINNRSPLREREPQDPMQCPLLIWLVKLERRAIVTLQSPILVRFMQNTIACYQQVEIAAHEAAERVLRRADDRLTRTLKLVLTNTGQPVTSLKRVNSR